MSQLSIFISSQSFISILNAQSDSFCEFFKSSSSELSESEAQSSSEIPDSQDSSNFNELQDSQKFLKISAISQDQRIQIQTALLFKISHSKICEVLDITEKQIKYARRHQVTSQKSKTDKNL